MLRRLLIWRVSVVWYLVSFFGTVLVALLAINLYILTTWRGLPALSVIDLKMYKVERRRASDP